MLHLKNQIEWLFWVVVVGAACFAALNMIYSPAWPPNALIFPCISILVAGLIGLLILAPLEYAILATSLLALMPADPAVSQFPSLPAAIVLALLTIRLGPVSLAKVKTLNQRGRWALGLSVAWLGWSIVAAIGSPKPVDSLLQAASLAAIVLGGLSTGLALVEKPLEQAKWLQTATISLGIVALWTIMRFGSLAKAAPSPFWQDANFLSAGLVLLIPLLLHALRSTFLQNRKLRSLAVGLAILLFLVGILKFNSRGAWLSLVVVALFVPIFAAKSKRSKIIGLSILVIVGAAIVLVLPRISQPASPSPSLQRLQSIGDPQNFSNRERLMRWRCAARMTVAAPVIGQGPGQFAGTFKDYLRGPEEVAQIAYWFGWKWGAHNDALTTMAETGIPGLCLFLASLIAWIIQLGRRPSTMSHFHFLALLAALLSFLVHAQVNDLLSNACLTAWVFVILGGSLGTEKT